MHRVLSDSRARLSLLSYAYAATVTGNSREIFQKLKTFGTRETISLWISTRETSFSEFSIFFQCCFEAQNLMQYYLKRTRAYSQGLYGGSSHVLFPQWRLQYGFAYSGQFHGLSSFVPKFAGSFMSCRVKILHWCSGSLYRSQWYKRRAQSCCELHKRFLCLCASDYFNKGIAIHVLKKLLKSVVEYLC